MLLLKLLQQLHLLGLITSRLPQLLLPLIIHHLLDHTPRLAIQITQLAVLRLNLGGVDFRRGGHNVGPPFHFVDLVEVNGDFFAGGGGFEGPG